MFQTAAARESKHRTGALPATSRCRAAPLACRDRARGGNFENNDGIANSGLARADVGDADLVHPIVAEVIGVCDDGLARLQDVAQADLGGRLAGCGAPASSMGKP